MIKRSLFTVGLVALLTVMVAFPVWAVPQLINYQGKLTDSGGSPLDGVHLMIFSLYELDTGGSDIWDEQQSVTVTNGIYSVQLGSVSGFPAGLFENYPNLYLQVEIFATGEGWEILSPRQHLTSTAYSMRAADADTLDGMDSSEFADSGHDHPFGEITGSATDFQIPNDITIDYAATSAYAYSADSATTAISADYATTASDADMVDGYDATDFAEDIHQHSGGDITTGTVADALIAASIARDSELTWGNLSNIPAGFDDGVDNVGMTTSSDYGRSGVSSNLYEGTITLTNKYVNQSGDDMMGRLRASVTPYGTGWQEAIKGSLLTSRAVGAGVFGFTEGSEAYGVYGAASGASGRGVKGEATGTYGRGVWGEATGTVSTNHGGFFTASGPTGRGVYGGASGASGRGVYGKATNTGNVTNYGGYFVAEGLIGRGVYGESSSGTGVYGESSTGYGVYGKNYQFGNYGVLGMGGTGVYGFSSSSIGYGVYGQNTTGDAGKFVGPVTVTGYLTKLGGGFQIDHPLDPENKYLNHSFVESPDMMNIYNGNVVLDANGERWVELPEWFEALNKDFRYQLTCIGGFAQVYIAQEISDNRFKIAGGNSGMKVSWQVTGIRQDPWAEANLKPVEEDKAADELGFYLSPESYGQSEEKGVEWGRNPEMMQRMKEEKEKSVESKEPAAG